jgi:hypothetical protein
LLALANSLKRFQGWPIPFALDGKRISGEFLSHAYIAIDGAADA